MKSKNSRKIIVHILLLLGITITVFPFVWMILTFLRQSERNFEPQKPRRISPLISKMFTMQIPPTIFQSRYRGSCTPTALDDLEEKWGKKYPASIGSWRNNWTQLSTYFKYPSEEVSDRCVFIYRNSTSVWKSIFEHNYINCGNNCCTGVVLLYGSLCICKNRIPV